MITDISTLPTASLSSFLSKKNLGLQNVVVTDGRIIVFAKRFNTETGEHLADECIADVPIQDIKDEINSCQLRIDMIKQFIVDNSEIFS